MPSSLTATDVRQELCLILTPPQCLGECLVHSRVSINESWIHFRNQAKGLASCSNDQCGSTTLKSIPSQDKGQSILSHSELIIILLSIIDFIWHFQWRCGLFIYLWNFPSKEYLGLLIAKKNKNKNIKKTLCVFIKHQSKMHHVLKMVIFKFFWFHFNYFNYIYI